MINKAVGSCKKSQEPRVKSHSDPTVGSPDRRSLGYMNLAAREDGIENSRWHLMHIVSLKTGN